MTDVLTLISNVGLLPVVEVPDASLAVALADALIAGGLPCIEVTFRTEGAAAAIGAICRQRPEMLVGAGTVVTKAQVDAALGAGARFVVSPGFDPDIVDYCAERSVLVVPGVVTPSEVQRARAHGAEVLKFFPAEAAGGASYLKALCGPFATARFVPSGGIGLEALERYLSVPQVVAVGGSWMAPRALLQSRDFATVEKLAREATEHVHALRAPAAGAGGNGVARDTVPRDTTEGRRK